MIGFKRFALYVAPPPGPFAAFGAAWLGWDAARGTAVRQPEVAGLPRPLAEITAAPRKYGFHATVKPPFRLLEGVEADALHRAAATLCATLEPVVLGGLRLTRLGDFLALVPEEEPPELNRLAARVVETLDPFRAPLTRDEIARRESVPLTPAQAALLARWGYPYVMGEFRFHMTLTGRLAPGEMPPVEAALAPRLAPVLPRPFAIESLCLFGEAADGRFHLLRRYPLGAGAGG